MGIVWAVGHQSEGTLLPALVHYPGNVGLHTPLCFVSYCQKEGKGLRRKVFVIQVPTQTKARFWRGRDRQIYVAPLVSSRPVRDFVSKLR